ncbi:MAG: putative metal-dependent hydrolase [Bacteroidetes bacterium]|nr:putative metal-dependent hydrolase [Bacteroidota bacterium]
MDLEQLKYPVGKFISKPRYELEELLQSVVKIQALPNELAKLLNGITPEQLQKTYRPDGWTAQQVIHHLADSHMNAWIRTKLILTEDNPTVKPYMESVWANGKDYTFTHESSYVILVGLHQRWSLLLLETLKNPELLLRTYFHPEHNKTFDLAYLISLYGWHSDHHLAHIRNAINS